MNGMIKSKTCQLICVYLFVSYVFNLGVAQNIEANEQSQGQKQSKSNRIAELELSIANLEVVDLNIPSLLGQAQRGSAVVSFKGYELILTVEKHKLWEGTMPTFVDDGSELRRVYLPEPFLYKGSVVGKAESDLRLTISSDTSWISGYIRFDDEWLIVEPAKFGDVKPEESPHAVYRKSDVKSNGGSCETIETELQLLPQKTYGRTQKTAVSAKFWAHGDFEFYLIDPNNWPDRQAAVLNDVEGIFSAAIGVDFLITQFMVFVVSGPPFDATDASELLAAFRNEYRQADQPTRQFMHIFTGKDMDGSTIGIAHLSSIGRCWGYALVQQVSNFLGIQYESSAYNKMILSAHEIGHNFSAVHADAEVEGSFNPFCLFQQYTIMTASFQSGCMTDHFSDANVSRMENFDNVFNDNIAPTSHVNIESGQIYTSSRQVDLNFSVSDVGIGVALIGFRNSSTNKFDFEACFPGGTSSIPWTLTTGDGLKEVVLVAYDNVDNRTQTSDDIILDQTLPSTVSNLRSPSHVVGKCSTDRTVSICWDAATDATSGVAAYSILWSKNSSSEPDCSKDLEFFENCAISDILSNGLWYFSVRALDKAGWCGNVSRIGPFEIGDSPSTPTISGPSEACGDKSYQFSASASNIPTGWSWSDNCGGSFNPPNGNPTNWTAPQGYTGFCQISVVASNACGSSIPGIKPVNVKQVLESTQLESPENGMAVSRLDSLTWKSVNGAQMYQVLIDEDPLFGSPNIDTMVNTTVLRDVLKDTLRLFPNTIYHWVVMVQNECGWSDTSSIWSFVILTTEVVEIDNPELPLRFTLMQNFPNPFNPATKIEFALPTASFVTLNIYNLLGEKVKTLVSEWLSAGYKAVTWNGTNDFGHSVSSGVYFYRILANDYVETKKMMLLK